MLKPIVRGRMVQGEAREEGQVSIRWDIIDYGKDFRFYFKHIRFH